jgi:PadR family transcriptional regulator
LLKQGAAAAEWTRSDNGRRVRVYCLTRKGRKQLAEEPSRWEQLTLAIAGMMVPPATEEA